ncbi:MAG: hypothetical protein Q8N73_02140, partial [bacterium]|nr:hypothetical protein [bacterium]
MSLSLSKFKILKRANIFWIIFLSVILLLTIGYQGKAMATSCADCSRCPGARVYGNIYDANTGGGISGATVTVSTTATSGVQCPSTSSSVHGWCGPKSGSTTSNSAGYYNFARVDGLYCFVNCGWGYSAPWRLSVSHPNYSSNSTTFSPTNGSETVVNLRLTPKSTPTPTPTPTITCWSCNTNTYTCSSQSYSGYYCPSGTYSTLSSCQNNCQASLYYVLNISKTVRNITDNTTFQESVAADPLERVEFNILITSTGSTGVQSVIVKDSLPLHITYQNNLKIDGISSAGDILTGLNLGTISPGQSKVITFEAQVSSEDQFIYGITTLTNAAIAYNVNTAKTDTAQIIVPRKAVAGAATEVKTGIVNRALDYILFPLIITFIIILVFKNYIVFLNEWFE